MKDEESYGGGVFPPHAGEASSLERTESPERIKSCEHGEQQRPYIVRPNADNPRDLQIAGLVPMSAVDWPSKLVATVFCQGCPWLCPYCHNHAIIDPRIPGVVDWERVEALLKKRHDLLDGVVFSGGEATRQISLGAAMRRVHEMGFSVGLHTAGPYPSRLKDLLAAGLVDWVGMDIKAMPGSAYEQVAQRPQAGVKAWESLQVLLQYEDAVDYEVRVTVYPQGPRDVLEVARAVRDMGVHTFALQQARSTGAPSDFLATTDGWDERVIRWAQEIKHIGFRQFIFRPAV
ncbi:anaerobic ribonucleoside-triphosphate reductase activating protein [Schaalia sp. lx-260]|uniref:anaerobic ribonucleoside-triphosphate reductase activating protein n=1 Tax=Schaalia sp. lx-260 TaxID=2899082 RepID=UPI0022AC690E|nr:anaerobic ribonucleoside-triphosphate reductase activating protein [Schaalia sp. lx-260]